MGGIATLTRRSLLVFVTLTALATPPVAAGALGAVPVPVAARTDCAWAQWGRTSAHNGQACGSGQDARRELAHLTIDPFVVQEQAESSGDLLTHYQVPLLDADGGVFVLQKKGTYVSCNPPGSGEPAPCGPAAWQNLTWSERALVWTRGHLVDRWTFASDWKPVPVQSGWEPMFQPALAGNFIYVPGRGGTVYELDRRTGRVKRHVNPFGTAIDRTRYVTGGLTVDADGNVYYNVLKLNPQNPWFGNAHGSLVRVTPTGHVSQIDYANLVPRAAGTSQRPAVNVTPAIGPDGTIFTVSRAHVDGQNAYVVALRPSLTVRWAAPLGLGEANDSSSSSPTALPDGGVLYGALSLSNGSRGFLLKFDPAGQPAGSFDFGWDTTPAIYRHGKTFSIVLKDNNYLTNGPYFITQLDANLNIEWQFQATNTLTCQRQPDGSVQCVDDGLHPNGFEWCINAPAVDRNGTVYVTSEDGNFYAINQGGTERSRFFLGRALGAAYTPLAIDPSGRLYAMNNGELSVLGR